MVTNPDVTWTQASAAIFSVLELNLGVACNSMARLKPFIRMHFPQWAGSFGNSNHTPAGYHRSDRNKGELPLRGDKVSHSYQLGSIEWKNRHAAAENQGKDIHIMDEFQVEFEGRTSRKNQRYSSTESILAPEQDNRRVV